MPDFTIYYGDGSTVSGSTRNQWRNAPAVGVQAVVLWEVPHYTERPWTNVSDRKLWTGDDTYNPFGWGVKSGALLPDAAYRQIWNRAFYDARPD
jgi:hypothetical protein